MITKDSFSLSLNGFISFSAGLKTTNGYSFSIGENSLVIPTGFTYSATPNTGDPTRISKFAVVKVNLNAGNSATIDLTSVNDETSCSSTSMGYVKAIIAFASGGNVSNPEFRVGGGSTTFNGWGLNTTAFTVSSLFPFCILVGNSIQVTGSNKDLVVQNHTSVNKQITLLILGD